MVQSFAIGIIYYGVSSLAVGTQLTIRNVFYIPIFLQYVKSYTSLISGTFILATTFPQAMWGVGAGYYISKTSHYKRIVMGGAAIWTLSIGLQLLWHPTTNVGEILGILEIQAIGIGWSLQPPLVAALAATADKDRAVVTAGRNFFRTLGGAFSLAASNTIYQACVAKRLASITALSAEQRTTLLNSSLGLDALPPALVRQIREAYSYGLRYVFICFTAVGAVYFATSFAIKEIPFRKDSAAREAEKRAAKGGVESPAAKAEKAEKAEGEVAAEEVGESEQAGKNETSERVGGE